MNQISISFAVAKRNRKRYNKSSCDILYASRAFMSNDVGENVRGYHADRHAESSARFSLGLEVRTTPTRPLSTDQTECDVTLSTQQKRATVIAASPPSPAHCTGSGTRRAWRSGTRRRSRARSGPPRS